MDADVTLATLLEAITRLRVDYAREKRKNADLFYHLDEENMPAVAEKLSSLAAALSLLVSGGEINGAALLAALNNTGGGLCIDGACAPAAYAAATERTEGMRPLYINEDGMLCAGL